MRINWRWLAAAVLIAGLCFLAAARADLISNLMGAPRKVAGHSRVVDIEKAIDSPEAAIDAARLVLGTTEDMEGRE